MNNTHDSDWSGRSARTILMRNQKLFNYLSREHDITPIASEMHEIEMIVARMLATDRTQEAARSGDESSANFTTDAPGVSAICGNCTHYEPHRDSQTGRVHPSKQGRCVWKPNLKWPMAYRRNGYGCHEQDPIICPVKVWKHTDAKTCACFSPKGKNTL